MPPAGTNVIECGELAEWSKAPHCSRGTPHRMSFVRIEYSPPELICGDVCEWLKQLTRKVRGPVKIRVQRFESSHHRQLSEALGKWRAHPVRSGTSFRM